MAKQSVTTYVGCRFSVAKAELENSDTGEKIDTRVLIVQDGAEQLRFPIPAELASRLADDLRGDGIVTSRAMPKMDVPRGR